MRPLGEIGEIAEGREEVAQVAATAGTIEGLPVAPDWNQSRSVRSVAGAGLTAGACLRRIALERQSGDGSAS